MYATHVPVSLERIPGNTCCPKYARASVSSSGVLTTATMARGGTWITSGKRRLKASELQALRSDLRSFNPATLKPTNSAGCNGAPIGDVGGYDLKVGRHESNCPPRSANKLIRLLSRWLPASEATSFLNNGRAGDAKASRSPLRLGGGARGRASRGGSGRRAPR